VYLLLAECIRSGQCDAAQVEAHFADRVFARWYRRHYAMKAGQ
jgi:hypothetical protein